MAMIDSLSAPTRNEHARDGEPEVKLRCPVEPLVKIF
jgi:hypothetical protein